MIQAYWLKVGAEWRANRRLRLAVLVGLVVLAFHVLAALGEQRKTFVERYTDDRELLARMEGISGESEWTGRAQDAATAFEALQAQMPGVSGSGLAQAELQNWLSDLAASTGVTEAQVRVQDTLDVPEHPELLQVLARLDGMIPRYGQADFLRRAAQGLPWIQVERLDIAEGTPARVGLVARGYYRRVEASAAPGGADAAQQPAATSKPQTPPETPAAPAAAASPDAAAPPASPPPRPGARPGGSKATQQDRPFGPPANMPQNWPPTNQAPTPAPATPRVSPPPGGSQGAPGFRPPAPVVTPPQGPPASEARIIQPPPGGAGRRGNNAPPGGNR